MNISYNTILLYFIEKTDKTRVYVNNEMRINDLANKMLLLYPTDDKSPLISTDMIHAVDPNQTINKIFKPFETFHIIDRSMFEYKLNDEKMKIWVGHKSGKLLQYMGVEILPPEWDEAINSIHNYIAKLTHEINMLNSNKNTPE